MQIEQTNAEYAQCRIPGLIQTKNGTLLGYYECRSSFWDWAEIDLKVIRSTDKGEHWECVLVISGQGNTLNNPVMIVDEEIIHFLYCKNYKQLFYCKSVDDGQSFSRVEEKTSVFEENNRFFNVVAIGPGHGIVHNGNLIVPVWFAYNKVDAKAHHPSYIRTIYSMDRGKTWKMGEQIGDDFFVDPSECALAVTKEGDVFMSIRNENMERKRGRAISKTGYNHWSNIGFMNLMDPICQGSMDYTKDWIYHINCDSVSERENLTIKKSQDCFQTVELLYIDEQGGYADLVVGEEEVYILYERNIWKDGLYFKKVKF